MGKDSGGFAVEDGEKMSLQAKTPALNALDLDLLEEVAGYSGSLCLTLVKELIQECRHLRTLSASQAEALDLMEKGLL